MTIVNSGLKGLIYTLFITGSHNDVVKIVEAASKHNVVIMPFGGLYNSDLLLASKTSNYVS